MTIKQRVRKLEERLTPNELQVVICNDVFRPATGYVTEPQVSAVTFSVGDECVSLERKAGEGLEALYRRSAKLIKEMVQASNVIAICGADARL